MPNLRQMLYCDHAATTPLRPEAAEAMEPYLGDRFGNPSGIHGVSRRAKDAMERAREQAAAILGAEHPLDIVFTGGGTESDNLAVAGHLLSAGGGLVTSSVEHPAVRETAAFLTRLGHSVVTVGVDRAGRVDPAEVGMAVDEGTALVSIMSANNETGVRQPVAEAAAAARAASPRVLVHSDAVQSFVSEEVTAGGLGADMLSLSAHKFGGPQGVGLLYASRDIGLEPVIRGGGQELGRRSGTHNVAGIVGMAAAMEAAVKDRDRFRSDVGAARTGFEAALLAAVPDVVFTTPAADRLIQHSHWRVPGVDAETLLIRLDALGLAAAAGSACHSGAMEVSDVLTAMGLSEPEARGGVRFSFGWTTRPEDGPEAATRVATCVGDLR